MLRIYTQIIALVAKIIKQPQHNKGQEGKGRDGGWGGGGGAVVEKQIYTKE